MKNITIKQYSQLADVSKYELLEHLKPVNEFAGHKMNINQMPYANVKYCIRLMGKVQSWDIIQQLFEICYDVKEADFWQAGIKEFFLAKKFMIGEFERIIQTEVKMLASNNTDQHLWELAGAERLKPFSDTLPLVQLGKMFGQYPYDLGRKPYSEIFNLLVQTKTQNEVEREYQKLTTK